MNIVFWLLIASLVLLALVIIVLPLLRKVDAAGDTTELHNISIARQRLADLKQQRQDGVLSQADYDLQFQELELTLSQDLAAGQKPVSSSMQGKWVVWLVIGFVPLLSLIGYFLLGEPEALAKMQFAQQARQQQEAAQQTIDQMVAGLAAKLAKNPNDAEGWQMLGRSYKYLKQYPQAAAAYEKAYRLLGDRPDIMLSYADALASIDGSLKGKAGGLVFKALALQPDNQMGLWLAGMAKVELGEIPQALSYWHKLETMLDDSPELNNLKKLIAAVKSKSEEPSETQPSSSTSASAAQVQVDVAIADSVQNQVHTNDTVFVYAQATNGPKVPLAIVRKSVAELPLSVVLNDAMAMMPGRNLSSAGAIKVIARVSKTGQAMQQSGDLIGVAELDRVQSDSAVAITIDRRVP